MAARSRRPKAGSPSTPGRSTSAPDPVQATPRPAPHGGAQADPAYTNLLNLRWDLRGLHRWLREALVRAASRRGRPPEKYCRERIFDYQKDYDTHWRRAVELGLTTSPLNWA